MKLDYKLPLKKMGKLPKRLMLRCALSCIALLCLSLAFHHKTLPVPLSPVSQSAAATEKTSLKINLANNDVNVVNLGHINSNNSQNNAQNDNQTLNLSGPALTLKNTNEMAHSQNPAKVSEKAAEETTNTLSKASTTQSSSKEKNWRIITIKKGDTLAKIFKRYGYSKKDLQEILNANPEHQKQLTSLKTNQIVKLWLTPEKRVQGLTFDLPQGKTLNLAKNTINSKIEEKVQGKQALENKPNPAQETAASASIQPAAGKQIAFGKGVIRDSLFSSAKRAGLDHNVIAQMVEIFGWNVDFSSGLRPNDSFRVLFEEKSQNGERVTTGAILAAEIINHGKIHRAIRYTDKSGRSEYFSPDGNGMRQAFLRYPVNFTRISSGFGQRHHPVFHRMRHHKGIDYSAPAGTPVQATGDAKVLFIGTRGGYGKVIELAHGARYSTLYAHLSRFAKNLKTGSEVKQGQIIGYVGRTGLATGNHLHYELRMGHINLDPHTFIPKKTPIPNAHKSHFLAHAKEMLRLMDLHENKINVVRNEYPKNE